MNEKIKYVFVILVYKNSSDLEDCILSIEKFVKSFRIIVVNAYYDEKTREDIQKISARYKCDFLNIENKGYSYGNNRGIEFANRKYNYDYVVISNPDIIIREFNEEILLSPSGYDIVAPEITAASGRKQNPMSIKRNVLSEYLEYKGFKHNNNALVVFGMLISKVSRIAYRLWYNIRNLSSYKIYCAHGSFVILSRKSVDTLFPVYDENMFLFAEEGVLAIKAARSSLSTGFWKGIKIDHKEDGSMKLSDIKMNDEVRKANIYFYEKYVK